MSSQIPFDNSIIKECLRIYNEGGARHEVASFIRNKTDLKRTASFRWAKVIWENEFNENSLISEGGDNEFEPPDKSTNFKQETENRAVAQSKSDNIKTLDDLLRVCEVDLETWQVDRHIVNKWEVAAKDDSGVLRHAPLYQVKAWLSRKEEKQIENVINLINKTVLPKSPRKPKEGSSSLMYEISIPDLHLSKLCWGKESGEDYNINIAADVFREAVENLLSRVDLEKLDKVLLPVGNDFFNSEGLSGATTRGTRQDDDSRWQKSFSVGCSLISDTVEKIADKTNIEVVLVSGNHDYERVYYLGEYLKAFFRNDERVKINNNPTARKYVEFGENLILFTHGNNEKQADLPMLMATEHPNFSKCKFRTAHLGHLHQERVKETYGVSVKILPSLCPADAWHSEKGYVKNKRSAIGFLYDAKNGEIANYYFNI